MLLPGSSFSPGSEDISSLSFSSLQDLKMLPPGASFLFFVYYFIAYFSFNPFIIPAVMRIFF